MSSPATLETSSEKASDVEKKHPPKKMHRPKRWREEIDGVKQPCWCGEQWTDYHEDGNHGPIMY